MSDVSLKELLEAGSHFGHQARRWNPAMKSYIYAHREGIHIFDLVKTKTGLDEACEYLKGIAAEGGKILFVGTKRQAVGIVKAEAEKVGMPYVTLRWLGGMLTNFEQIHKSGRRLETLKDQRAKGELKKYTKYEQLQIDREIAKLERFLGGVAGLNRLPEAMFVVDTHREEVAVREGVRMHVPVVGMVDTNGDPTLVNYVIPINDDAVNSIKIVVEAVGKAIAEGLQKTEKPAEAAEAEEAPKTEKKPRVKKVKGEKDES